MKHYESKAVVCPFYHQEQPTKIHCDGFGEDNTVQISFTSKEAKNSHRKAHCLNIKQYTKCPLYETIAKKYEENDDDE